MCTVANRTSGLYDVWLAILTPLLTIFNKVLYIKLGGSFLHFLSQSSS